MLRLTPRYAASEGYSVDVVLIIVGRGPPAYATVSSITPCYPGNTLQVAIALSDTVLGRPLKRLYHLHRVQMSDERFPVALQAGGA